MSVPSKTKVITARVTPADHRDFKRAVKGKGRPSDVLRQLVRQFIRENLP
ncbi:MAG: hypothetical protein WC551_10815 [Patescibacteria group bacterium]